MSRELKFRAFNQYGMGNTFTLAEVSTFDPDKDGKVSWSEDTVFMQFTGLKDKNGVEIYEGDIVRSQDIYGPYTGEIEWWNDRWCLAYNGHRDKSIQFQSLMTVKAPEVIGNIHQNPELL